jgi:phenylacetate-coenzyme A ligase PaaK-like adenylate-forming protein
VNVIDPFLTFTTVFPRQLPAVAIRAMHLYRQMRAFERFAPGRQEAILAAQLTHLLRHARARSPFWAERLARWRPGAKSCADLLQEVPILSRTDVQENFKRLLADFPQREALGMLTHTSSGTTGTPVKIELARAIFAPLYYAVTMMNGAWHKLDPKKSFGILRSKIEDKESVSLGAPFSWFGPVGNGFQLNTWGRSDRELFEYCAGKKPHYLQTGPTTLIKLARHAIANHRTDLRVEQCITLGSVVTEETRQTVREGLGASIADSYSCEEAGFIALQCPSHTTYHVVSPVTFVEIVDENGAPCPIGRRGRVLLTSPQSYRMPLLRYDIGDMAEWGEPCDCGIRLPVIAKLWGRTRQLFTTPDGRETYGRIYARDFADVSGLLEYRFVLHQNAMVDAQLKVATMAQGIADMVKERLHRALSYPYPVRIRIVESIDWGSSWKQESFAVSDAPPPLETT